MTSGHFTKGCSFFPLSTHTIVSRTRLNKRLNDTQTARYHSISAPAGFGKTTLMQDWLKHQQQAAIWVTLNSGHDSVTGLVKALQKSIQDTGIELPEHSADDQQEEEFTSASLLAGLADILTRAKDTGFLVIDNLHIVQTPATLAFLAELVNALPENIYLYLLSRQPLPSVLFRAAQWSDLNRLSADDLAFTVEEGKQYLRALQNEGYLERVTLSASCGWMSTLWQQTEGWPVFFCALVNDCIKRDVRITRQEQVSALPGFELYLQTQLCPHLVPAQCERLRQLATLNSFTRDMMTRCLFPADSAVRLQELINFSGVVLKNSTVAGEYSIRRPLKEYLISQLPLDINEQQQVFTKAYRWRLANDQLCEAVSLCLDSDYLLAGIYLIEKHCQAIVETSRWDDITQWLEIIPAHIIECRPLLLMLQARKALFESMPALAAAALSQARHLLQGSERINHPNDIYCSARRADLLQEIESLSSVAEAFHFSDTDSNTVATESSLLGRYHLALQTFFRGDFHQARSQLRQVMEQALICDTGILMQCLPISGWVHYLIGEADVWESTLMSLEDRLGSSEEVRHWSAWASASKVAGLLESAAEKDVVQALAEASVLQEHCAPVDLHYFILTAKARLYMRQQNWTDARDMLAQAEVKCQVMPELMQQSMYSLTALKAELALAQNKKHEALQLLQLRGGQFDAHSFSVQHERVVESEILLALDQPEQAQNIAKQTKEWAEQRRCGMLLTHALLMQSLACRKLARDEKAQRLFGDALDVGRMTGSFWMFVRKESSEIKQLLLQAKNQSRYPAYVKQLIDQYGENFVMDDDESANISALSKRERQVLDLLVKGLSNPEIADTLCRSLGTIKIHVHNIYRKLGAANRVTAINKYLAARA